MIADLGLSTNMLPKSRERFQLNRARVEKLDPTIAKRVLVVAPSLVNNVVGRKVTRKLAIRLFRRKGLRIATASVANYVLTLGSAIAASISSWTMKLAGNAHVER